MFHVVEEVVVAHLLAVVITILSPVRELLAAALLIRLTASLSAEVRVAVEVTVDIAMVAVFVLEAEN